MQEARCSFSLRSPYAFLCAHVVRVEEAGRFTPPPNKVFSALRATGVGRRSGRAGAAADLVAALVKPLRAAPGAKLKNAEAAQADLSGFEC
jgi:hypothetical protein